MADFDSWITPNGQYIARLTVNVEDRADEGYTNIYWSLWFIHQYSACFGSRTHYVYIDGQQYPCTSSKLNCSGSGSEYLGSGMHQIWHRDGRNVGCSAQISIDASISGAYRGEYYPSGNVWIAQFAPITVNPTLPTWINVSGNLDNWVDMNNPLLNVSWGGANPRFIYNSKILYRYKQIWRR